MPNPTEIVANIDGGSRGNPGPAAFGVVIKTAHGGAVAEIAEYIGKTTNNFAEYQGLLAALEYCLDHGYSRLRVLTDSELMANQIAGRYKVRSPDLKPLHARAQSMIALLESFSIQHVFREQNREADRLVNQALDNQEQAVIAPPASTSNSAKPLSVSATFQDGSLHPSSQLPLFEGEQVDLEIRRKK